VLRVASKSIKSWIVFYAGFIAAIAFAETGIAMTPPELNNWSPVIVQADAPALKVEPVVRRSDI
jgi:hypothetical protein